jgi:hypothetical protein
MSLRRSLASPRRVPGRRGGARSGLLWAVLAALLLAPLAVPVAAQEPGETQMIGAYSLLWPIRHNLAGSAWVSASGLDPRLAPFASTRNSDPAYDYMMAPGSGARAAVVSAQPLVPFREPGPSFSRNILITRAIGLFGIQTEPHTPSTW